MGGCASKPKESDIPETPTSPEKPQLETAAQDNANGGESQIEKPLVDLSEPEKEAQGSSSEPEAVAVVEAVSSETVAETAKPTEDVDVKATVPATEVEAEKSSAATSKEE